MWLPCGGRAGGSATPFASRRITLIIFSLSGFYPKGALHRKVVSGRIGSIPAPVDAGQGCGQGRVAVALSGVKADTKGN